MLTRERLREGTGAYNRLGRGAVLPARGLPQADGALSSSPHGCFISATVRAAPQKPFLNWPGCDKIDS